MIENMVETDSYWHHNHHHFHSDTEPAFVVRPGQSCCPEPEEECVCVTQDDVDYWNNAADTVSSISSLTSVDVSSISSLNTLYTSANLWNSNYSSVNENSGFWNDASKLNSAFEQIKQLSATITSFNIKTDDTLTGDGIISALGVSNYKKLTADVNNIKNLIYPDKYNKNQTSLFKYDEQGNTIPNFIPITGTGEVSWDDFISFTATQKSAVNDVLSGAISRNDKQIQQLEEIVKNLAKGAGSGNICKRIDENTITSFEDIEKLNEPNTLYLDWYKF